MSLDFTLSKHARRRLRQRGISLDMIARTMQYPDRVEIDREDPEVKHSIKRFHLTGRSIVLRVLYNHVVTPPRIVTAFFDRRLRRTQL
jgi:hypothetical protein